MTSILTVTAEDIIEGALIKAGIVPQGSDIPAADHEFTLKTLNYLLKTLQTDGFHLWTKTEGVIFLTQGTQKYDLGVSGDHSSTSFVNVSATAAIASGLAVIPVVSTGMTAADFIGIELDDGTRQWSTISTVDSAAQVTIADVLTDDVASGNTIFTYTNKLPRPLRVIDGRQTRTTTNTEIPMTIWNRQQYFEQNDKTTQDSVLNFYYSPQLATGEFYVWPTSNNVNQYLNITFIRPADIVVNNSDAPDIPSEWVQPLIDMLAAKILPSYKIDPARQQILNEDAAISKDEALGFDHEFASMFIGPDQQGRNW